MRLVCWNVNGIRSAARKGLHEILAELNPDIFCAQETKIGEQDIETEAPRFEDYEAFYSSALKRGYSGVGTFLKPTVAKGVNAVRTGINKPDFDNEGRFLITDHDAFRLYNVYCPSGTTGDIRQDFKYTFLDAFLRHLKSIKKEIRQRTILCGDFNICHRDIDIHHPATATKRELSGFLPDERAWIDALLQAGFHDAFREVHGDVSDQYTWWSFRAQSRKKNLGWRIDYFFVGEALRPRITRAEILPDIEGSDHCPLLLELDV